MKGKKRKPCLRCDRPMWTTPERRICTECRHVDSNYTRALSGIEYNKHFYRAVNTRGNDQ